MGVVGEIERQLAGLRAREGTQGMPELRTSTMTHLVWCPPDWLPAARRTLAGLGERHPARTILLVPEPGRKSEISAAATLRDFQVPGLSREVLSEVIEIRLRGAAARHPGSIALPLLIPDLPVFCRWRGEPAWASSELEEITEVCDRLVVDSIEWRGVPASYARLAALFDDVAVSDIAFSRTVSWRRALADRWPAIADIERIRVEGPRADAELLAGWLRSRLKRAVSLTRRHADAVRAVWVDGDAVAFSGEPLTPSELLSTELDQFGRDRIYEAAARDVAHP
jgi:Glucose-6-phosphate dehydrogenase subunit